MPDFNLDAALHELLGWDLAFAFKGRRYVTRPPTIAELFVIEKLGQEKGKDSEFKMLHLVGQLFEDGEAAIGVMPLTLLPIVVNRIFDYFKEYTEKNSQAVAKATAAGMRGGPLSGK